MTKQIYSMYLSPEAVATLKALAAALGCTNQRGEASLSSLNDELARIAGGAFNELAAAVKIAAGCAAGEDWNELIDLITPKMAEGK